MRTQSEGMEAMWLGRNPRGKGTMAKHSTPGFRIWDNLLYRRVLFCWS
ncbi:hypothetical protein JI435_083610 [Parastagonospora nodorum SN15]|uniref:Uncharacterized protein n=1 Tax=Phaeosphaeria nodorum (strain SN15 / ATCC MYA-4574 / FGSC 10173) TaxID=321614 RepID=A0A7U2ETP1_PHANO|nr:hypothetical protein JI435_083610 [Parastagonospora nodorum SN15]